MADRKLFLVTGGAGFSASISSGIFWRRGHAVPDHDIAPLTTRNGQPFKKFWRYSRQGNGGSRHGRSGRCCAHSGGASVIRGKDIYTTDVLGTRTVLTSARRYGLIIVIHISSTAVYGIRIITRYSKMSRLDGVKALWQSENLAEEVCLAMQKKSGMCVPIIRPKSFVGPGTSRCFCAVL